MRFSRALSVISKFGTYASRNNAQLNLRLLKATSQDYDNVMDINRYVSYGNDLLTSHYKNFVNDKNRVCYIGRVDDEVAYFHMFNLIDDKKRAVMTLSRMKEKYQNKGLYTQFNTEAMHQVKNKYPSVEKMLWTMADGKTANDIVEWNKACKSLCTRYVTYGEFAVPYNIGKGKKLTTNFENCDVTKLVGKEMYPFLNKVIENSDICPEKNWIINWQTFGALKSNLELMVHPFSLPHPLICKSSMDHDAVSLGTAYWAPIGLHYTVDYYCHHSLYFQEDLLKAHVHKHLTELLLMIKGCPPNLKIAFEVVYPMAFHRSSVEYMFYTDMAMKPPNERFNCYCLEMDYD